MSQVTRSLSFEYKGESIEFSPNMMLLRKLHNACIESRTTLVALANSVAQRSPDVFTLAYAAQIMLAAGGKHVTEDECYRWAATGAEGNAKEMGSFMAALLNLIFPEVDVGKKPEGQLQSGAPVTTKKTTRKKAR